MTGEPSVSPPLSGVRVLAMENLIAMPCATGILASMGATVIKLEPVKTGEVGRGSLPITRGVGNAPYGAAFLRYARGKQSIAVDLKQPEGRAIIERLIGTVDVFAQNLRGGAAEKLNLGPSDLHAINPSLIYASISGYGQFPESKYAAFPSFATVADTMAGYYESFAGIDNEPPAIGVYGGIADITSGHNAAMGILGALLGTMKDGTGRIVDISLLDAALALNDNAVQSAATGADLSTGRPAHAGVVDLFQASDGHFVVTAFRVNQLDRLLSIIGREDLIGDPRFQHRGEWSSHVPTLLRPPIERWAADKTKREAALILSEIGVPAAPSLSPAELIKDDQIAARGMIVPITGPIPESRVVGTAVNLVNTSKGDSVVPRLGEHTRSVLRELAQFTDAEIDKLVTNGIVEDDPFNVLA